MFDDARGVFEDRAQAGRRLGADVGDGWDVGEAIVVAFGAGGQEVAQALAEPGQPVRVVDTLAAVSRLPDALGRTLILVDDGERTTEEVAAAAWSLMWTRPARLVVAVPLASRYLEAALPPECSVVTLRRFYPVRDDLFVFAADERRHFREVEDPDPHDVAPARRFPRPPRTGRPWDPEEEEKLDALVREGKPLPEIATALGRTRGGVSTRIAQLAIRRGGVPPPAAPLPNDHF